MTDNTLPPENCICASFYTVRGKHKPDCPLYRNTLDKILDEELGGFGKDSEVQAVLNVIKPQLKRKLKDREKQMLEFVIGEDREVKGNYDYRINEEKSNQRQRAKEWEKR